MTRKEFLKMGREFSPEVAKKIVELEVAIDNLFLVKRKYKKSEYKAIKKIVTGIIISEAIPLIGSRIAQKIIELNDINKAKASKLTN